MFVEKDRAGRLILTTHLYAVPDDPLTVRMAVKDFGFLVARNEKLSFEDFSGRIGSQYDRRDPKVNAVMLALTDAARKAAAFGAIGQTQS